MQSRSKIANISKTGVNFTINILFKPQTPPQTRNGEIITTLNLKTGLQQGCQA